MSGRRVRRLFVTNLEFDLLVAAAGANTLAALGSYIAQRTGVPDAVLVEVKPDGIQKQLFFVSQTFEALGCCEGSAPEWRPEIKV